MAADKIDTGFSVVVQNIPEDWDHYTVEDFLDVCSDGRSDIRQIEYFCDVKSVAKTGFKDHVDFKEVVKKGTKEKPQIIMTELSAPEGLVISNLPPDVTLDTVCQYFEEAEDGGPSDVLQEKKFYPQLNVAVFYIDNEAVIDSLVNITLDGDMKVNVFYENFHGEVINRLTDLESVIQDNSDESTSSSDDEDLNNDSDVDDVIVGDTTRAKPLLSFINDDCNNNLNSVSDEDEEDIDEEENIFEDAIEAIDSQVVCQLPEETIPDLRESVKISRSDYSFGPRDSYKAKLLVKCGFDKDDHPCKITINIETSCVMFEGADSDINIGKVRMFEKIRTIDRQQSRPLPLPFLVILKSAKGQLYLDSIFGAQNDVIGFLEDEYLVIVSFSAALSSRFLTICDNLFLVEKIPLVDSYKHFIGSGTWMEVKGHMEEQYLVKIRLEDNSIVMYGLNGDVKIVCQDVKEVLHKNQHQTKTLLFKGAKACCMSLFFKSSITALRDILRVCQGYLKDDFKDGTYKIELSGSPEKIQHVEAKLIEIEKSVWHSKLVFKRDLVQGRELNQLVKGLKSANQKRFKTTFDVENNCCLEFHNLDPAQQPNLLTSRFSPPSTSRSSQRPRFVKPTPKPRISTVNIAQATIIVKQGDIVNEKADVLVNVLSKDLVLQHTAIGHSFSRAGGSEFVKNFELEKAINGFSSSPQKLKDPSLQALSAPVAATYSHATVGAILDSDGARLGCKRVIHVLLEKWRGNPSAQVLTTVINGVFQKALHLKATSIAFPSLGCGKMFQFPADKMASSAITTLQQSISKYPSIKKVTFVIHDKDVYTEFLEQMGKLIGSSSPRQQSSLESNYEEYFNDDDSDEESDEDSDEDSDDEFTIATFGDIEIPESTEACIKLFSSNKDLCEKAKKNLMKYLKENYLYEDSVKDETIIKLNRPIRKDIKEHAERNNVSVHLPEITRRDLKKTSSLQIKLQGEVQAVHKVKVTIQEILLREVHKTHKFDDRSQESGVPKKGTMEFLNYMALKRQREPPTYWKKYKTFFSKLTKTGFLKDKLMLETISSSSSLYKCIDDLVQKTWRSDKVGQGADAVNLKHKNIKVTKIERLENLNLYHKYCDRRCELFAKALKLGVSFTNIDRIPSSSGPMLTTKFAGPELKQDMYPEVNEHYVFHGTQISKVESICNHGLDQRACSENGLFGFACYTAESSTKADQYADEKAMRTPGTKKMILARILLGNPYLCTNKNPPKYKKPPCMNLTHLDPKCTQGHEFFDTVMGDKTWLFREFAVYDDRSTYPEYVITYNRY